MPIFAALKKYYGFDTFLDYQQSIVEEIIEGRDICVIMPTGAGKSLCFQLPILIKKGYGIVVSPLISLMKDQVDSLLERNIPAGLINSTTPLPEQKQILSQVATGEVKILYVAPERFQTDSFAAFLHQCAPEIMIIDEAHCISQWGHDFRPSYFRLGNVLDRFQIPQVCAFTATATPKVQSDIKALLHRPQMSVKVAGFKRPNLSFSVVKCDNDAAKSAFIRGAVREKIPTIIYASTRKAVEKLTAEFKILGYHAGMSDEERERVQNAFMNDEAPVLAATNAFGMGIDRPDVRRVIHYNLPGSLEAYYQEAGRAGRDGESAECVLLYAWQDKFVQEFLIDLSNPPAEVIVSLHQLLLRLGQNNGGDLQISTGELALQVPDVKSESQINAALAVLEKAGVIERAYSKNSTGTLRFLPPEAELAAAHFEQKTQRSRFIMQMLERFGGQLYHSVQISTEEMTAIARLNLDQVKRVLTALNHDILEWQPPFPGKNIKILNFEPKLAIDFAALNDKRTFETDRLNEVLHYANARSCRQKFITDYFAEKSGNWTCHTCDNCQGKTVSALPGRGGAAAIAKPVKSAVDGEVYRVILAAVNDFDGRLGSGKISQILAGSKTAAIAEKKLHLNRHFGKLELYSQTNLMARIQELEDNHYLNRVQRGMFPCLEVAAKGHEVLANHAQVVIK